MTKSDRNMFILLFFVFLWIVFLIKPDNPNRSYSSKIVDLTSEDYYCYRDFDLAIDTAFSFSVHKHFGSGFILKRIEDVKVSCKDFLNKKLPHLSSDQTEILYQTLKKDKKSLKKRGSFYFKKSDIDLLFEKGRY